MGCLSGGRAGWYRVQSLVIDFDKEGSRDCRTFLVHTPLVCVPKTDGNTITLELKSWMLAFLGRVAPRFEFLGLSQDCFDRFTIQGTVVCWDALATNHSILKRLRFLIHMKQQADGYGVVYPLYSSVCLLHQLSLSRKPCVYHFPSVWSSVVRLAHLFETHSFRMSFRSALIKLIVANYRFVQVIGRSDEMKSWRQKRNWLCGLYTNNASYSTKRRQLHLQLMQYDNGDPESPQWTHWCQGKCCSSAGDSAEDRSNFNLLQICKGYTLLFAMGFACPLLYRWVHAHQALEWTKAPWPEPGLDCFMMRSRMIHCLIFCLSNAPKPQSWPWPRSYGNQGHGEIERFSAVFLLDTSIFCSQSVAS